MPEPIACSLASGDFADRLDAWRRLLAGAIGCARGETPGEVCLSFPAGTAVAELAALCADEVACCPFFTFQIGIAEEGVTLRIGVPPDAAAVLDDLLGLAPEDVRAGWTSVP